MLSSRLIPHRQQRVALRPMRSVQSVKSVASFCFFCKPMSVQSMQCPLINELISKRIARTSFTAPSRLASCRVPQGP